MDFYSFMREEEIVSTDVAKPKLEKIFQGEYLGKFLFDHEEKSGYMLAEKVLSKIKPNTVEKEKNLNFLKIFLRL